MLTNPWVIHIPIVEIVGDMKNTRICYIHVCVCVCIYLKVETTNSEIIILKA